MELIIASFHLFLSGIEAGYGGGLYQTEARRLSRGPVLKRFLALKLETEMFMNEKGKLVPELRIKSSFEILHCDMIPATTEITSAKLPGQQKLISDKFEAVRAFEMKLKPFRKPLRNVVLFIFLRSAS
jgi:hypothetical protein